MRTVVLDCRVLNPRVGSSTILWDLPEIVKAMAPVSSPLVFMLQKFLGSSAR